MPRPPCPYLGVRDGSTGAATPSYSYEFFPPLTQPGTLNLHDRILRLASLKPGPAAISITWGAGGSTSERSLGLAEFVTRNIEGTEVVMHLTCTNMAREKVVEALEVSRAHHRPPTAERIRAQASATLSLTACLPLSRVSLI